MTPDCGRSQLYKGANVWFQELFPVEKREKGKGQTFLVFFKVIYDLELMALHSCVNISAFMFLCGFWMQARRSFIFMMS